MERRQSGLVFIDQVKQLGFKASFKSDEVRWVFDTTMAQIGVHHYLNKWGHQNVFSDTDYGHAEQAVETIAMVSVQVYLFVRRVLLSPCNFAHV